MGVLWVGLCVNLFEPFWPGEKGCAVVGLLVCWIMLMLMLFWMLMLPDLWSCCIVYDEYRRVGAWWVLHM